ncbi:hypothetical protein FRC02_000296 [Tulasnella sp. 418]|nr:hypothetical protein FRC02_000296 [Tulasnella sp. 418]
MVRSYIRHGPTQAFGLVCSPGANSIYDGKLAFVPALEDILVWDVKKGQMLSMWHESGHRAEVTCVVRAPQKNRFAVGYADGSIRLWNSETEAVEVTFNGHKRAVTALAFDSQGARLASGSQDTDIIIWDVEAEAGLYRLRGHRDQLTGLRFITPPSSTSTALGYLITSSKDTFMKLWDLTTQHCIQTIVAHRSEIWALDSDPAGELIFTGSGEGELKAWSIDTEALSEGMKEAENGELTKMIHPVGALPLTTNHRVSQISFHPQKPYLAVQSHDRSVEIFRIRTEEEVKKKRARRQKRAKEKEKSSEKGKERADEKDNTAVVVDEDIVELADLFTPYLVVRASGKIRSFDFVNPDISPKGGVQILTALANNALEIYHIPPPKKSKDEDPLESNKLYSLDLPGHRTDIRTLCLSSNDELLASGSNGSLKVWNMKTTSCIRTMECGYSICSTFLPGDRHIAVGTKSGELLIFDISSSTLIDTIKAHDGAIYSIDLRPNKTGLATGSADKEVKFWDFDYTVEGPDGRKGGLALVHVKTLKMTDDVLAVRFSPNGKFLAVALLDSTVKIFYQDTLKFFISLYGHKLPVLSMDISDDSKLIVTCSADKNVKIWGLDFGDCHKSIFAHEDSIMQVAFEKNSHYFWTVGKDKFVKYWDGDKFENIQKLDGHHGEVWALAVSNRGNFVVTGSHDKSIRVWEKTDEPLFLEEEREKELEQLYEKGIADSMNREDKPPDADAEASAVNKQTTETLMAGERIIEALDIADADREATKGYLEAKAKLSDSNAAKLPPPAKHAVLAAYELDGPAYVLRVVERIQSTALHDALLVLPFGKVVSLLTYLSEWAHREWNISLSSRILFFLLRTHHHQIVANRTMRTVLVELRTNLRDALRKQKEEIGYNVAALKYIRQQDDAKRTAQFYEEENMDEAKVRIRIMEGKKRKRINIKT